jgi:hypothetical protein
MTAAAEAVSWSYSSRPTSSYPSRATTALGGWALLTTEICLVVSCSTLEENVQLTKIAVSPVNATAKSPTRLSMVQPARKEISQCQSVQKIGAVHYENRQLRRSETLRLRNVASMQYFRNAAKSRSYSGPNNQRIKAAHIYCT